MTQWFQNGNALYLGWRGANDQSLLQRHEITRVVDCRGDVHGFEWPGHPFQVVLKITAPTKNKVMLRVVGVIVVVEAFWE